MTTIYGVYQQIEYEPYDEYGGPVEGLVQIFATNALAEQFISDYHRLCYEASSDSDGWLVRFWRDALDRTIATYGAAAAGDKSRREPRYVRDNPYWGETPAARRAKWRAYDTRDAQGRIEDAKKTVSRTLASATRARNMDFDVWVKRHFPDGTGFYIKPVEICDRPMVYADIRHDAVAEDYLRGHNEG